MTVPPTMPLTATVATVVPTAVPATVPTATAAGTVDPRTYVNAVFDHIAKASIRRKVVDIEALRAVALQTTATAPDIASTYPAIRAAVAALGDPHAFFYDPNQARSLLEGTTTGFGVQVVGGTTLFVVPGSPAFAAGLRDGDTVIEVDGKAYGPTKIADLGATVRFTVLRGDPAVRLEITVTKGPVVTTRVPTGRSVDDRIALVEVPGASGNRDAQLRFVAAATETFRSLDAPARCGWILDLRRNTGGFPYATLAGVAPLLGDAIIGGAVDVNDVVTRWSIRDGGVFVGDSRVEAASPVRLLRPDVPIAVLTSTLTASAGERVVIAAIGRDGTRSFGAATTGLTSSTLMQPFVDGSAVGVTTSYDIDRFGVPYSGPITPGTAVPIDWTRFGRADDPVVVAAASWLRSQPACA